MDTYTIIVRDVKKDCDRAIGYEDGSDLLDALDWLPDNNELLAVLYNGKYLEVRTWEELRKHVSG